ncbi:MAG: kelch repeat-containing protein, partial [Acidimicrobiales bacterium]
MATQTLRCERHGESTRLTCVECNQPICPKCLVRTEVGLKCESCAKAVAAPAAALALLDRPSRKPLYLGAAGVAVLVVAAVAIFARPGGDGDGIPPPLPPVGQWVDSTNEANAGTTTATALADGRVLVVGGGSGAVVLADARIFDLVTSSWRDTGSLSDARRGHQAVLLADGRVLVTGGRGADAPDPITSAEVFDPRTEGWARVGPMGTARLGHSLTVLRDGRALAAGGGNPASPESSAELFNPATGTWSGAGSMNSPRFEHTATLLENDERVLFVGGIGPITGGAGPQRTTELYVAARGGPGAFLRSNDLTEARSNHTAVGLPDGRVLVAGGVGGPAADLSLATVELFDPKAGAWGIDDPMSITRTGASATLLADGRVLVAGGETVNRGSRRSLDSSEVYAGAESWRSAGDMGCPRSEHAAVRLGDGSVLAVGGDFIQPGLQPQPKPCAVRY